MRVSIPFVGAGDVLDRDSLDGGIREMFSTEENENLNDIAVGLAYSSLRFSRLYLELENEEWDAMAKELASEARTVINNRIQARIDLIEARSAA